ncbi:hypothetical protein F511_47593 [Dorcoceras hygrometricum]|uniref:Uncharacterized protein n=1 Tax=Dorcoceras hygrometricum TaxID=472368 RepID=A0A2Z6ZQP5_9LAMI|nr:hypothetical protein F511_47593 [Dorcoceras hygrometricum]
MDLELKLLDQVFEPMYLKHYFRAKRVSGKFFKKAAAIHWINHIHLIEDAYRQLESQSTQRRGTAPYLSSAESAYSKAGDSSLSILSSSIADISI